MRSAFLTALCVAEMRISSSGRAFSLTSTSNEAAVKSLCVDEADAWRETHTPAKQVPPTHTLTSPSVHLPSPKGSGM